MSIGLVAINLLQEEKFEFKVIVGISIDSGRRRKSKTKSPLCVFYDNFVSFLALTAPMSIGSWSFFLQDGFVLLKKQPSLVPSSFVVALMIFSLPNKNMLTRDPRAKGCFSTENMQTIAHALHCAVPASSRTKGSCQPGTTSLKHNKDKASVQQQHHQQQKRRKIGTSILILATTSHCSQLF